MPVMTMWRVSTCLGVLSRQRTLAESGNESHLIRIRNITPLLACERRKKITVFEDVDVLTNAKRRDKVALYEKALRAAKGE